MSGFEFSENASRLHRILIESIPLCGWCDNHVQYIGDKFCCESCRDEAMEEAHYNNELARKSRMK